MHISDRNRLEKEKTALVLGAIDMRHAIAAARALSAESDDLDLMRALETAMAVCFMRPYTNCDFRLPAEMFPPADDQSQEANLFEMLSVYRDQVYAHTDRGGGRSAGSIEVLEGDEITNLNYQEEWLPFPREAIPYVIDLCERLQREMLIGAVIRQKMLAEDVPVA